MAKLLPKFFRAPTQRKKWAFPITISIKRLQGEIMFFYSTDEYNRYPSMDKYAKILILGYPGKHKLKISGKWPGFSDQRNFYFSFTAIDSANFSFTVEFTRVKKKKIVREKQEDLL